MQSGRGLQICTDGWRRREAAQGVPLINVVLLTRSGGAIFLKVLEMNASEHHGADFIADLHENIAKDLLKQLRALQGLPEYTEVELREASALLILTSLLLMNDLINSIFLIMINCASLSLGYVD